MDKLVQIYNALLQISTKGEDSFILVDCLRALKQYIEEEVQKQNKEVK